MCQTKHSVLNQNNTGDASESQMANELKDFTRETCTQTHKRRHLGWCAEPKVITKLRECLNSPEVVARNLRLELQSALNYTEVVYFLLDCIGQKTSFAFPHLYSCSHCLQFFKRPADSTKKVVICNDR